MNHCKDPYQPISIMECHKGFDRCSGDFVVAPAGGTERRRARFALDTCSLTASSSAASQPYIGGISYRQVGKMVRRASVLGNY